MYNFLSLHGRMYLLTYNRFNVCIPHTITNRRQIQFLPMVIMSE